METMRWWWWTGLGTLAVLGAAAAPAGAQSATDRGYAEEATERVPAAADRGPDGRLAFPVRPASSSVTVDGVLDEAAWEDAAEIPLLWETDPGDNTAAPVRTECRVTFDDENLYFACTAHDPDPSRIRAYVTDRDRIGDQDRIAVAIDPFNDSRRAFEFVVSPLGVQGDRFYDEQRGFPDDSWDAIWASAGRIVEDGYRIEAAVPFRSLRFPSSEGVQTWGFHARRVWPRSERVETRSLPLDRSDGCLLCQANLLVGIRGVSPAANIEIVPTLTAERSDDLDGGAPGDGLEAGSVEAEPGVDLRWGITSDVALNATVNPDFSQVEADAAQLDVNTRFALFFPERRPFFLEGADIFRTPMQTVFTRTIADPVAGAKLTGKSGGWAGGLLVARDRINNLLFPGNQSSSTASLDQGVTSAIGRFRRDVGESSTVGGLYTGRFGEDGYENHVAGVDAFLRPVSSVGLRLQYVHTETRYPDAVAEARDQPLGRFGGDGVLVGANWNTRRWDAGVDYFQRDDGFRADAGFISRVDMRRYGANLGRTFWGGSDRWFTRFTVRGGAWRSETLDGRLNDEGLWSFLSLTGPLQSRIWANPFFRREFFADDTFDILAFWGGASIRPSGRVGLGLDFKLGDQIDFRNAREADQLEIAPSVSVRIGRKTVLSADHTFQRLSLGGEEIFTANLTQLRGVYNFDARAFVRAIVQYRRTDRNPELNRGEVAPERTSLFSQLLFSYKLNPLTALFVGYTDDRMGLVNEERTRLPLSQVGRTFFLKVGYAWRP